MGQIISTGENINTIVTWPLDAMRQIQNNNMVTAAGGLVVGVGGAYYVFGSPIEPLEALDYKTLIFWYAAGGIGYWLGTTLMQKINSGSGYQ